MSPEELYEYHRALNDLQRAREKTEALRREYSHLGEERFNPSFRETEDPHSSHTAMLEHAERTLHRSTSRLCEEATMNVVWHQFVDSLEQRDPQRAIIESIAALRELR
jgi:hypothetical protein